MTKKKLLDELKQKDDLLPQDILSNTDVERLAAELMSIFKDEQDELRSNEKFRANFTELVNYIYLETLDREPEERNKKIFSDNLIHFLLSAPPTPI